MRGLLSGKKLNILILLVAIAVMVFISQQTLEQIPKFIRNSRICHFFEYAIFSVIFFRIFYLYKFRFPCLCAIVFATAIGACDEILQIGVKGRAFDPMDLFADAAGAIAAQLAFPIKYLWITQESRNSC